MSELTNKYGIPIRLGQVWFDDMHYRVVGFDDEEIITRDDKAEFEAWLYTGHCFTHLISDPEWGDMSEWRIVTEREKENDVPSCAQYWHEQWCAVEPWMCKWRDLDALVVWRVPRDFEWPSEKTNKSKCAESMAPIPIRSSDYYKEHVVGWNDGHTILLDFINEMALKINKILKFMSEGSL